jgi:hypothetical protein
MSLALENQIRGILHDPAERLPLPGLLLHLSQIGAAADGRRDAPVVGRYPIWLRLARRLTWLRGDGGSTLQERGCARDDSCRPARRGWLALPR